MRLQFGLRFTSVQCRLGVRDQGRWSRLNQCGQPRSELIMRLGSAADKHRSGTRRVRIGDTADLIHALFGCTYVPHRCRVNSLAQRGPAHRRDLNVCPLPVALFTRWRCSGRRGRRFKSGHLDPAHRPHPSQGMWPLSVYPVQQQVQQRPTPLAVLPTQSAPSWGAGEEVRSRILRALLRAVVGAARIRIPVCGQLGRGPGMVPEG
jgi:hypothetical protein